MRTTTKKWASILFIVIFLLYVQTLFSEFLNWDDNLNIFNNPFLLKGQILYFWKNIYYELYIPLSYTVWTWLANGDATPNPFLFHLTNVFIHAINTVQVYYILNIVIKIINKNRARGISATNADKGQNEAISTNLAALLGAILFGVHPFQVNAVAWASGMRDLLGTFFGLGAIQIYLRGRIQATAQSYEVIHKNKIYNPALLTSLLISLGLLSKPSIISIPIGLFILDFSLFKYEIKKLMVRLATISLPAGLISFYTLSIQNSGKFNFWIPPWILRPIIVLDSLGFYICKFFWPMHLMIDYGRTSQWVIANHSYLLNGLVVFLFMSIIYLSRKKIGSGVAMGVSLTAALLCPTLGFVPFEFQEVSNVSDHYMYLPMLGMSLAFSSLAIYFQEKKTRRIAFSILGIFLVLLAVRTLARIPVWKNDRVFFTQWIKDNPNSAIGYSNLGGLNLIEGNLDLAEILCKKSLQLNPSNPTVVANLGHIYFSRGQYERVLNEILPYLSNSEFLEKNKAKPYFMSSVYYQIGLTYYTIANVDEAFIYFCRAAQLNPLYIDALRDKKEIWPRILSDCLHL